MIRIPYPKYDFRIKEEEGREWIFDSFRKQWVRLTPEEWVRQNTLQYLIQTKQYPPALIAVEKEIRVGELRKRFDILVYKNAVPWLIVECKEMNVTIGEAALRQALTYHSQLGTEHLVITNGKETYCYAIQESGITESPELPAF
ncbi:MAG: type I restriction enzyme HsdR N-terminal domain-containing protein [Bacteroidota bacterium]|nr:type I restriction enzyme HsdR N-terminal domain-containing protein [Bacteroidota bacterium]